MKALTLWQPWASLMAEGAKHIETRSWWPPRNQLRTLIAIHAGMGADIEFRKDPEVRAALPRGHVSPRGALVAVGYLSGAVNTEAVPPTLLEGEERFGDYTPGRVAWLFTHIQKLPEPIPMKGHQGLWTIPEEDLARTLFINWREHFDQLEEEE